MRGGKLHSSVVSAGDEVKVIVTSVKSRKVYTHETSGSKFLGSISLPKDYEHKTCIIAEGLANVNGKTVRCILILLHPSEEEEEKEKEIRIKL